jgi:hypothetical protein
MIGARDGAGHSSEMALPSLTGEGMSATRPFLFGGVDDALAVLVLELV